MPSKPVAVRLAAIAMLLAAAACAPVPPLQRVVEMRVPDDTPFVAGGRLSGRNGKGAVTAHFRWAHDAPRDEIELSTVLGQTVAELTGDTTAKVARIRFADGKSFEGPDWQSLTTQALGFALPVAGLAFWIRGGPHADSPHRADLDAEGRAVALTQDGWEIGYEYEDLSRRPQRMSLRRAPVEVRLTIDTWER